MPMFFSVTSEMDTHIIRPVLTQLAHHIIERLNLSRVIGDEIYIRTGIWNQPKNTRKNHSFRVRTNSVLIDATIEPINQPIYGGLYDSRHTHGNLIPYRQLFWHYPMIFHDDEADIKMYENIVPCSITMNMLIRMCSRAHGFEIPDRYLSSFSPGTVHTITIAYDVPVPNDILSMMFSLYKHRDLSDSIKIDCDSGDVKPSFKNYMDRYQKVPFGVLISRTLKHPEFVYSKTILDSKFHLEALPSGVETSGASQLSPDFYDTSVTFKLQFERTNGIFLQFPCVVDNKLLPSNMLPKPRSVDTPIQSAIKNAGHPIELFEANYLRTKIINREPIQCPFFDDWVLPPSGYLRDQSYLPFFTIMILKPEDTDTEVIDLTKCFGESYRLHEKVLEVLKLQKEESFRVDCIFNISVFLRDTPLDSIRMRLDDDLKLYIQCTDIHLQRRLVLSEITDIKYLNEKWYPIIDDEFFHIHDQSKGVNDADYWSFRTAFNRIIAVTGQRSA